MRRDIGIALVLLAGLGCENQDADRLARLSQCALDKAGGAAAGADRLAAGWQALMTEGGGLPLESRVGARLRWDRRLEGADVTAEVNQAAVELKGTVLNLDQRRLAVELAETTSGVEKVLDNLEVREAP